MSTNEMSPTLEAAFEQYQKGDKLGAENTLRQAVSSVKAEFGADSAECANAWYELGSLLSLMDRKADAAKALRQACKINIPDDTHATRDRLTYLMQLGELYDSAGELDEAEKVLRLGLKLRKDFYGEDHPGFAFGMEPLASVMMNRGDLDQALQLVEATIDNFWKNGHPRVATAFPLRALILHRRGSVESAFDGLDELPDEILSDMAMQALNSVLKPDNATESQAVLTELLFLVKRRLGADHQATVDVQTVLANLGRETGSGEGRIELIEKVIATHEAQGNIANAVQAMLSLALAQSDTGNPNGALKTYKRALKQVEQLGDDALKSQTLRNLGLLYSEQDRKPEAEQAMRMAAAAGKKSGDKVMFGRSLVALGIFLQHDDRLDDARKFLSNALKLLDPSHPDGICARSHLTAIDSNESCGCGDMSGAICQAFRQYLLEQAPDGLVDDIQVEMGDKDFRVDVKVSRELSEEEQDSLNRSLQQANIDFRKRLKEYN